MALSDAQQYWNRQAGEPVTQFISGQDAKDVTSRIYYDMEVGDTQIHDRIDAELVSLVQLKSVVAASVDFADFKTRVAAL